MDEEPSRQALEIGHLPTFTDNPYVLAKISMECNKVLRRLAKEQGFLLIDLEEWSRESLKPRENIFSISCISMKKQALLGQYLVTRLVAARALSKKR